MSELKTREALEECCREELIDLCESYLAEVKELTAQVERYEKPIGENELHYEDAQVMKALHGSEYLTRGVRHTLNQMTGGEKWSLYRAIVTLFMEGRKAAENG